MCQCSNHRSCWSTSWGINKASSRRRVSGCAYPRLQASILLTLSHFCRAPTPFPTPPTSSSPPNITGTSIITTRYLFPTPISWGYPQLDVMALTTNTSSAVYRKYRPSNATSSQDWYPRGSDFEPVGGGVNIGSSVAVRSRTQGGNTTDVYATGEDGGVYKKWYSNNQV